jgi:ADP-ribosylglycohydrolase
MRGLGLGDAFGETWFFRPVEVLGTALAKRWLNDGPSVTRRQFDGMGSWGNGAAMRVAPLGAWFAEDLDTVVAEAIRSAQVTHAHPEAAAGAVAVAVAAALSVRGAAGTDLIDAARTGLDGVPADWLTACEPLPSWVADLG